MSAYTPSTDALRVLNKMFDVLEAGGWECVEVFDGEETLAVMNRAAALAVIDSVEESFAKFRKDRVMHQVLLIPGNGEDVICDHSCTLTDDFNDLMDTVTG